ncbi:MAG: hypothetical protein V4722_20365 [Bacteroidota bacterium]
MKHRYFKEISIAINQSLKLVLVTLFFTNCSSNTEKQSQDDKTIIKAEAAQNDFVAAAEYEFNMIKNPTTGQIPKGIYEMELQQVREIRSSGIGNRLLANTYSYQGPNNLGGRTRALAYDVRFNGTSNQVILAGGVSNGIFKSTDNGANWLRKSPTGDHFSCTSLAQDPRPGFQNTWYYTTGEASGNSAGGSGAFYSGNGVYKSTDNGETWVRLVNSNTTAVESFTVGQDLINKVIVDPINGNVYIACAATIRRSIDGGTNWTTVLNGTLASSNQFTDIVVTSTGKLYAAFGGSNTAVVDGVWSSLPGGTSGDVGSWTKIAGTGSATNPVTWNAQAAYGRVVLAIAPSLESRVYALYYNNVSSSCAGVAAPEAELFRWDDGSSTWTDLSANLPNEAGCSDGNDPFAVQGGYDLVIAVKPDNPDAVFIGGTNIYRSTNGFTSTATNVRTGGYANTAGYGLYLNSHPDIHAIVFTPGNSNIMLCGNDGGIQRTTDNLAATVAWTPINTGYNTYQYYYVDIDPRVGNAKVMGGAQDNGTTRNVGGTGIDFELVMGGDGVSVGLSDLNAGVQTEYLGVQNGVIRRRQSTVAPGFFNATITPTGVSGGLFITLFKLDPDNTQNLYYANDNELFYTTSAATVTSSTWTALTGVATAVGAANDITAIATTRGTYNAATSSLFFGTNNSRVYRLDDPTGVAASTAPVNITGGSFPALGFISSISVNPRNDDTVLVTYSNYGVSSIWWTGNANSASPTWTAIEGNINLPSVRSSAIAVTNAGLEYYVGTSVGLYVTTGINGAGTSWSQEGIGTIGNAVVSNLALRTSDNNMVIGTHGHGIWKTNSISILPVDFISFNGKVNKTYNELQWKVANENNCNRYEVEKRNPKTNAFQKIGSVVWSRSGNAAVDYSFVDNGVDFGIASTSYRVKQVDNDNHFMYSPIITLQRTSSLTWVHSISLVSNQLFFRINNEDASEKINYALIDVNGRLLLQKAIPRISQAVTIPFNVANGIYTVHLMSTKDGKYTSRILVK